MMVSGYKNLQACREHIALVQHYFSKLKLVSLNFFLSKWSFLENGMSKFVGAAFEGLNEIIKKWVFYRM